jgi:hypothetical protein
MFDNITERDQFRLFRRAYKVITGDWLKRVRKSERPDYICERRDGSIVGVEFTLITRNPDQSQWGAIIDKVEYMDGQDAVLLIGEAIAKKGKKRAEPTWQFPESSILVLSTPDCPISDFEYFLDKSLQPEFQESGFSEIWIADHTELEAYGTIELFGLVPDTWWGHHPCPHRGKPYG